MHFCILQVINEELGMDLEKVNLDMLGSCKKVSSDSFITLNLAFFFCSVNMIVFIDAFFFFVFNT